MKRRGSAVLQSQNKLYGFFGSMGEAVEEAWALAMSLIMAATHCDEIEVRNCLDSRYGRQFADTVRCYLDRGHALDEAVAGAVVWAMPRAGHTASPLELTISQAWCSPVPAKNPFPRSGGDFFYPF